jgi:hypothetical protein
MEAYHGSQNWTPLWIEIRRHNKFITFYGYNKSKTSSGRPDFFFFFILIFIDLSYIGFEETKGAGKAIMIF